MEQKDSPLRLVFVWNTLYKPQAETFYEMPKITLLLKVELHNLLLEIHVRRTKLGFIKAELFLIFPCNSSMTLCLPKPQNLQLEISIIILEILNCK